MDVHLFLIGSVVSALNVTSGGAFSKEFAWTKLSYFLHVYARFASVGKSFHSLNHSCELVQVHMRFITSFFFLFCDLLFVWQVRNEIIIKRVVSLC